MRVLIVEDDADLRGLMQANLQKEGYEVDACGDGIEGLLFIRQGIFDLILLDRMLPGLDGLSVLRQARLEGLNVPIILITALGDITQRVEGLDTGADDYIVKPFALDELMARVRAVRRRPSDIAAEDIVEVAGVELLPREKLLRYRDKECILSKRESCLLEMLMRSPGKTLRRGEIFSYVWGVGADVEDSSLDSYIHFVRARLAGVGAPLQLVTQRGVGYRLEAADV